MSGSTIYRRLTRRKRVWSGYSQLWLAPDHLLLLRSAFFTEYYRRFFLADIQAIVVTELPRQVAFQFVALAAIIACTAAFFTVTALFLKILMGSMAAIALGIMIGDIALGPRCRCYLQTAVSREPLTPVRRVRTARGFLRQILPAIEAAQGTLAPERAAQIDSPGPAVEKPPEVPRGAGYLPEMLFGLFLLDAALIAAAARFPKAQLSSVLFTTMFGELVMLIVALARRGHDRRRYIYVLMLPALLCVAWDAMHLGGNFVGWINGVAASAKRGDASPPSIESWIRFSDSQAFFAGAWRLAAGAIGTAAAWLERR